MAANTLLEEPESDLRGALRDLGTAAGELSSFLESESTNLSAAITDVRTLAQSLTALAQDSLSHTIDDINVAVDQLQGTLTALEEASVSLDVFLEKINRGEGTLGKLATDDTLYHEVTDAAAALRRILEDLEQDPRKYLGEIRLVDIF